MNACMCVHGVCVCFVWLCEHSLQQKLFIELISRRDQSQPLRYSFKYPFFESNYEERYLATKLPSGYKYVATKLSVNGR